MRRLGQWYSVYLALQCEQHPQPITHSGDGLGLFVQYVSGRTADQKGGVMILFHPCHEAFNRTHHPSYVEFYHRILSMGTNSYDIHQYEREFAENPDYIHMYRHGHAYHGVHPFYMCGTGVMRVVHGWDRSLLWSPKISVFPSNWDGSLRQILTPL